ncbi:MAG: helix-turn-helix domain-containing protein [Nanoarchaeota archaeon]
MDTSVLEDLGLTHGEMKVYITLSELGSSVAGPIIEKTGLQNSVVHRALNSLIAKGLIAFLIEGRGKIYQISNPRNFLDYLEEKKRKFEEIIPELERRKKEAKEKKEAVTFMGKKGLNQMYTQLINSGGKEYNTFGGGKNVTYDVMGEIWWRNFHIKRIAKKIRSRQIFDETLRNYGEELNKLSYTKIRFLPKEFEQLTETIIIGDCVGIAIFTENPYGVVITDKTVVEGYKKQFELIWKLTKQ